MATRSQRRQATENRLKAMQHPLRRAALLHLIEHGVASPVEVAAELGEKVPNVSHHMKRLVALDCAEIVKEEKVRGSIKHYYRHTERHLIDTEEWEELDPLIREGLLVDFMQPGVDDFTTSAKAGILGANKDFHITRTPLAGMDREGLAEAMEAHEECRLKVLAAQAQSAMRLAETGGAPISVSSFQACFEVPGF